MTTYPDLTRTPRGQAAHAFDRFKSLVRRRTIPRNSDALVDLLANGPILDEGFSVLHAVLYVGQVQYSPADREGWRTIQHRALRLIQPQVSAGFGPRLSKPEKLRAAHAWRTLLAVERICYAATEPPRDLTIRGSSAAVGDQHGVLAAHA